MNSSEKNKTKFTIVDICVCAMFGTLMFASKLVMEAFPNIHLVGVFVCVATVLYRQKALLSIYVFVFLMGIYAGFTFWWVPYIYIWTILWAIVMLLPKNMSVRKASIVYPIICALHGVLYGTLYAPAQAIMYGFDFNQTITWIITGLPFDAIHGISNLFAGMLVYPLVKVAKKVIKTQK